MELSGLQARMVDFYSTSDSYYSDIDFTAASWTSDPCYLDIVSRLEGRRAIVEVGCGGANFLRHYSRFASCYSGCDFSTELIARNQRTHSKARFRQIEDPRRLPFEDATADALFSIYVIEHTVYPADFLTECWRVLRPGGLFILRCPDFLGASKMTSQRAGFAHGTGREKLHSGAVIDALVTGYDRKIRIPRTCARLREKIADHYGFYINLAPTCFFDPFAPDHDAVYLTYADEMVNFLRDRISFPDSWREVNACWPIYLVGTKISA
jgi:SAM-dependent methyltransferase